MAKLDDGTIANMEVALEKACRRFPNGGDHASRKYVAVKLMLQEGNTTLGGLDVVAHRALEEFSKQQSTA